MYLISLIIVLILIGLLSFPSTFESMTNPRLYLSSPTKCFSCERDMINRYGPEYAWMGKPSKCFSCEKDLINRYGPNAGNLGQGTKCFDCEKPWNL